MEGGPSGDCPSLDKRRDRRGAASGGFNGFSGLTGTLSEPCLAADVASLVLASGSCCSTDFASSLSASGR